EVTDTGVGMDEETRRRCLEPFFTTKGDRGTGLGLAMVYGMVQRHGAQMQIDSQAGAGTTMRLRFPVSGEAFTSSVRLTAAPEKVPPLRILVVDDDTVLLESLRDTLEMDGHSVVTASGGLAGIDAFDDALEGGAPFQMVITDLGMPYVDGRKVAEHVRA